MHPMLSLFNLSPRSGAQRPFVQTQKSQQKGPIRRWIAAAFRQWQRQKMIAALQAMDSRVLQDIGIERCDIERVVDGFDDRELRMVPVARAQEAAHSAEVWFQRAA